MGSCLATNQSKGIPLSPKPTTPERQKFQQLVPDKTVENTSTPGNAPGSSVKINTTVASPNPQTSKAVDRFAGDDNSNNDVTNSIHKALQKKIAETKNKPITFARYDKLFHH